MTDIPHFTGSLDACVPAENVVLAHYLTEREQWLAISEASDGRVFFGVAATEPLARRAAGLRTLHHLKERADGKVPGLTDAQIKAARAELLMELDQLTRLVIGHNGDFPATGPRPVILIQLRAVRDLIRRSQNRSLVAKWALPVLIFLAGAFAEGAIGVVAEKCIERLSALLGS